MRDIRVRIKGIDDTGSAFKSFENRMERIDSSVASMSSRLGALTGIGAFALLATQADNFGRALLGNVAKIESLNKSLELSTGGGAAFLQAQEDITTQLNSSLSGAAELTEAYTKLANLGIAPTLERMQAFENVAAGSARSLDQFIEAVADASTNEFERLKEFGIKARKEGDEIALTFRGQTRTVGANSQEITEYLTRLGQVEFGGSISSQLNTISGSSAVFNKEGERLRDAFVDIVGAADGAKLALSTLSETFQSIRFSFEGTPETIAQIDERVIALEKTITRFSDFKPISGAIIAASTAEEIGEVSVRAGQAVAELNALLASRKALSSVTGTLLGSDLSQMQDLNATAIELREQINLLTGLPKRRGQANRALPQLREELEAVETQIFNMSDAFNELQSFGQLGEFDVTGLDTLTTAITRGQQYVSFRNRQAVAEKAANEELAKAYEPLLNNLSRQVALFGDSSNEAKILYDLQNGSLKGITGEIENQLLLRARELDALKASQQAELDRANALKSSASALESLLVTSDPIAGIVQSSEQANSALAEFNRLRTEDAQKSAEDLVNVYNSLGTRLADALNSSLPVGDNASASDLASLVAQQETQVDQLLAEGNITQQSALKARESLWATHRERLQELTSANQEFFNALATENLDPFQSLQSESNLRLEAITEAYDPILNADINLNELRLAEEKRFQEEVNKLVEDGYTGREALAVASTKSQVRGVLGQLALLTSGVASENRALFEVNKLASLGTAAMNAHESFTKAMAKGEPFTARLLAFTNFAAAMASVRQIASTEFGDTSSASTASASSGGGVSSDASQTDSVASVQSQGSSSSGPAIQQHFHIHAFSEADAAMGYVKARQAAAELGLDNPDADLIIAEAS